MKLKIQRSPGDGTCLFHSVAAQVQGYPNGHALRADVVKHLKVPNQTLAGLPVGEWTGVDAPSVAAYCNRMAGRGAWGGGVELAAMADMFHAKVRVFVPPRDGTRHAPCISTFHPSSPPTGPTIRLLYSGRAHYDALQSLD